MRKRYQAALSMFPVWSLRPGIGLVEALREGYTRAHLLADVMAGLVVGAVALPLSMALAINSGVPPHHGLYTAIVAGLIIAVLGGTRRQVSGPTAAFIAILAPISATHGLGGLLVATVMAGVILAAMGLFRLGRLIQFIPHPVTTGFTSGIAVVIALSQVDQLLGIPGPFPAHAVERVQVLWSRLPAAVPQDLGVGLLALAVLIGFPRLTRRVPAPVVALVVAGLAGVALDGLGLPVTTLEGRFSWTVGGATGQGIPPFPPLPVLPWSFPGADGQPLELSFALLRSLAPAAFAIAILGAIESLLSAVVADGMSGTRHDPDVELLAQGTGNIIAPFFGGIAATGAIARTATNIRAGAVSPISVVVHSLFVLAAVLVLAPLLGHLPLASMAALLLLTAWNMSEVRHFGHILRVAPRSDVAVLVAVFVLTVASDMVLSVSVGVVLASLLFMRRMAETSGAQLVDGEGRDRAQLPDGVLFYEIRGPLFFGAAEQAIRALASANVKERIVLLDLEDVPVMDVTGLVALESAIDRIHRGGGVVVLGGVRPQPMQVLERAGLRSRERVHIFGSVAEAVSFARREPAGGGSPAPVAAQAPPA